MIGAAQVTVENYGPGLLGIVRVFNDPSRPNDTAALTIDSTSDTQAVLVIGDDPSGLNSADFTRGGDQVLYQGNTTALTALCSAQFFSSVIQVNDTGSVGTTIVPGSIPVVVAGTGGPVVVNESQGQAVNLGEGGVQNIKGEVDIIGPSGASIAGLTLDDSADLVGRSVVVSPLAGGLFGVTGLAPAPVHFTASDFALTLMGGAGTGSYLVQDTAPGAAVHIAAGAGNDSFGVSAGPGGLASLSLDGGGGTNGLTVRAAAGNPPIVNTPNGAGSGTVTVGFTPPDSVSYVNVNSVSANAMSTTATLTASTPGPTTYGQTVTFTAVVANPFGPANPTGPVDFYLDYVPGGVNTSLGHAGLVNGVARLTTAKLPAGSHTVTAVYAGTATLVGSASSPLPLVVNPASVSIALTDSATGPVLYGTPLILTAAVTNTGGTPVSPTGTVNFLDGATLIGHARLVNGVASLTTPRLGGGVIHVLTAVYDSNPNFTAATSSAASQEVDQASTSAVLTNPSVGPVVFGSPVTLTDVVAGVGTPAVPTGTVTFYSGATVVGRAALDKTGKATITPTLPAGAPDTLTAVYAGTANFTGNTSNAESQEVDQAGTLTTLTSSPTSSTIYGQPVTFTATVANIFLLRRARPGRSAFSTARPCWAGPRSAPAGWPRSRPRPSPRTRTRSRRRTPAQRISPPASRPRSALTVDLADTLTSLTSSAAGSMIYGQSVTFTATVANISTSVAPTGTVSFFNGTTLLEPGHDHWRGGHAHNLDPRRGHVRGHRLVPWHGGFRPGISAALLGLTVNQAGTEPTSTSSPTDSTVYGQTKFTATVASVSSLVAPTGTVGFFNGTTLLGQAVIRAGGVATLTTSTLAADTYSVTASYPGTADFAPGVSAALGLTVETAITAASLSSSAATTIYGQPVSIDPIGLQHQHHPQSRTAAR